MEYLRENNIEYLTQKVFDDCKGRRKKLRFDFYIPKYNLVIEYNGEQHYRPIKGWGEDKTFEKRCLNDKIKKEYCLDKSINYLEIPFWVDTLKVLQNCLSNFSKRP